MVEGETCPPSLLHEADLIALMEKHGIGVLRLVSRSVTALTAACTMYTLSLGCAGTDATHAEHIETIKSRLYVGVQPDGSFVPGELGIGLVEG